MALGAYSIPTSSMQDSARCIKNCEDVLETVRGATACPRV
jgi:hypothetical protein